MKKKLINICLASLMSLAAVSSASANEPSFYENARSLGMGGVSVTYTDDYMTLYRNPAGLSLQKKTSYSVLSPTFSRNSDYSNVIDNINALNDSDTAANRSSNYRHLEGIMGKTGYQRWSDTAYYISENGFGLSIRYDDYQFYTIDNPSSPRIKSSIYKDTVFSGSYSRAFEDDNTNLFRDKATGWWGVSLKVASRKMTETSYSARDFAALTPRALKDTDRTGLAFDADAGALWQLTNPMKTTFGVFIGNLLKAKYSDETGRMKRTYSVGASIKPLTGEQERNDKLLLACEYIDDGAHINCLNKLRLGATIKLARGFHLLAGVKGGYLTGGLDYSWNDLTFTAATYGEELGNRPGDREDRRYAVDASLRF